MKPNIHSCIRILLIPVHSILVNCAGIFEQRPLAMASFDSVWRQVEVNFKGVRDSQADYHMDPRLSCADCRYLAHDHIVYSLARDERATSRLYYQHRFSFRYCRCSYVLRIQWARFLYVILIYFIFGSFRAGKFAITVPLANACGASAALNISPRSPRALKKVVI